MTGWDAARGPSPIPTLPHGLSSSERSALCLSFGCSAFHVLAAGRKKGRLWGVLWGLRVGSSGAPEQVRCGVAIDEHAGGNDGLRRLLVLLGRTLEARLAAAVQIGRGVETTDLAAHSTSPGGCPLVVLSGWGCQCCRRLSSGGSSLLAGHGIRCASASSGRRRCCVAAVEGDLASSLVGHQAHAVRWFAPVGETAASRRSRTRPPGADTAGLLDSSFHSRPNVPLRGPSAVHHPFGGRGHRYSFGR